MPVYRVQGPDGNVYRVEGPDGATAEQLGAFIQQQSEGRQARAQVAAEEDRKLYDPTNGMSTGERSLAGAGKAFADMGRGIGQYLGMVSHEDVAEARKRDAALMDTTSAKVGNFAGNVAMLAPTALLPGANTVTGAATIGAAAGMLQPSESSTETVKNTAIGAGASAALPGAVVGTKVAQSLIDPLYAAGRDKIVGRAIANASAQDPKQLAAALLTGTSPVPGVQRTAAEAANNPSLAAMQRTVTQTSPAAVNEAAARQMANNDWRLAALQGVKGDRQAAVQARDAATDALYKAANGRQIVVGNDLQDLLGRPQLRTAVSDARNLAENEGRAFSLQKATPPTPSTILDASGNPIGNTPGRPGSLMTEDAHTIKRSLDDTIENLAGQNGLGKNARRAAVQNKEAFLQEVEKQVPEYGLARQTYADLSKPVNRADVTDLLQERSVNALTGQISPAAYARALKDRTAQSALGRTNATLDDVYTPKEMATLNALKDDLERQNFAQTAGRGAGSDTVQKLAYINMLDQAGVPGMLRSFGPSGVVGNLAQRAGQVVYKDANEKLSEQLARALMDPAQAAALVNAGIVSPQALALSNALRRGGTAAGALAPALVQANQE